MTPTVATSNKLHAIIPVVGSSVMKKSLNRCDSSVLNRVQLGHTRLTHSHLLSGEPPPICSVCQTPLAIQHFMLDCPQFTVKRAKFFTATSRFKLLFYVFEMRWKPFDIFSVPTRDVPNQHLRSRDVETQTSCLLHHAIMFSDVLL